MNCVPLSNTIVSEDLAMMTSDLAFHNFDGIHVTPEIYQLK